MQSHVHATVSYSPPQYLPRSYPIFYRNESTWAQIKTKISTKERNIKLICRFHSPPPISFITRINFEWLFHGLKFILFVSSHPIIPPSPAYRNSPPVFLLCDPIESFRYKSSTDRGVEERWKRCPSLFSPLYLLPLLVCSHDDVSSRGYAPERHFTTQRGKRE